MKIRLYKHFWHFWILTAFAILLCAPARSAGLGSDVFNATVEQALVGGENEFATKQLLSLQYGKSDDDQARPENRAYRDQWAQIMMKLCKQRGDCKVKAVKGDYWENDKLVHGKTKLYRITYSDGWFYEVDVDVGVIEVRHKKSTIGTLELNENRMQKDIWDVAIKKLHLDVLPANAVHTHLGIEATWDNDLQEVRNDLVDSANHQEVGLLMTDDLTNAPPLSMIGRHQFTEFEKVIDEIDTGKITSVEDLGVQLEKRVFNRTFNMDMLTKYDKPQKYQAVNTTRMSGKLPLNERTIEYRDQPGVSTSRDYVRLAKLRVYRAAYINSLSGKIKLHKFNPDASPTALVSNYYGMITEVGLDWKDYHKFLRKKFRSVKPKQYVPTALEDDPAICVREKVREIYFKSYE